MRRFLFIGPDHGATVGGREQLSRLHRRALEELLGGDLDTILLPSDRLAGGGALRATLTGRIDGTTQAAEVSVVRHIAERDIGRVWLDGSNLGVLARTIKRRFPDVEVFTFFHNIEPRFFWGAFRRRPSIRALGVMLANFTAERHAARFSDRVVMLNARDAAGVRRWHGRTATDLLPIAIEDGWRGPDDAGQADGPSDSRSLLFVGGSFYANIAGIEWFAEQVAPAIGIETLVVGHGMDRHRERLERHPGIKVIGVADDLASYYRDALAVIAPIFDGSGMKTKVAEAWMHGKRVFGTREAFCGYEDLVPAAPCESSKEFIAAIASAIDVPPPRFDRRLRQAYDVNFSPAAFARALAHIIG